MLCNDDADVGCVAAAGVPPCKADADISKRSIPCTHSQ